MLVPIQASAAAMANRARACHTKRKAWRLENGYNVFARGQAVCDLDKAMLKDLALRSRCPKSNPSADAINP
jgi:hypothetical protein